MNIKSAIYEALSPRLRVLALLDASARNDENEIDRLLKTCPQKTYKMKDTDVTDTIDTINSTIVAVEADLRGAALDHIVFKAQGDFDAAHRCLQRLSDIQGGWLSLLNELGISEDLIERYSLEHHPIVTNLLNNCPTPNLHNVTERMGGVREFIPYLKSRG